MSTTLQGHLHYIRRNQSRVPVSALATAGKVSAAESPIENAIISDRR